MKKSTIDSHNACLRSICLYTKQNKLCDAHSNRIFASTSCAPDEFPNENFYYFIYTYIECANEIQEI